MTVTKAKNDVFIQNIQRNARIKDGLQLLNQNNNKLYAETINQSPGFWDENGGYTPATNAYVTIPNVFDMLMDGRNTRVFRFHAYGRNCSVRFSEFVGLDTGTLVLGGSDDWYYQDITLSHAGDISSFTYEVKYDDPSTLLLGGFFTSGFLTTAQLP